MDSGPAASVKEATDFLQSIPNLVDAVEKLPSLPFWCYLIFIVIFFGWLIVNKDISKIFDLLERGEKNKIDKLNQYLDKSNIADTKSIEAIRDLRDAHYFKTATGIYAENKLRKNLIELHNSTSHAINWSTIRLASNFLKFDSANKPYIRERNKSEKIEFIYNNFISGLFLLISSALFIFLLTSAKTFKSGMVCILAISVSMFIAFFSLSQNWRWTSATEIRSELKNKDDIQ